MSSKKLYLQRALYLAAKRQGFCAPNPAVGALVVKNDHVLGEGWHEEAGSMHAEVIALQRTGECAGATLYVSLEPCCHFGRTPPCTDLIIQKKIARVVYAHHDRDPRVASQSRAQLQAAGIYCDYQPSDAAARFYQAYDHWQMTKRPLFTAKLAMSLNGKIAGPHGARIQLTGRSAERFTHSNRYRADAILTTANTILADNPRFNVRLMERTIKKPLIVLDRQGRLTGNEQMWHTTSRVILLHGRAIEQAKYANLSQVSVISIPQINARFDLDVMARVLGELGFHHIWVEAGGELTQSLLLGNYLHRLYLLVAPAWVDSSGLDAFGQDCFRACAPVVKWRGCGRDVLGDFLFN